MICLHNPVFISVLYYLMLRYSDLKFANFKSEKITKKKIRSANNNVLIVAENSPSFLLAD